MSIPHCTINVDVHVKICAGGVPQSVAAGVFLLAYLFCHALLYMFVAGCFASTVSEDSPLASAPVIDAAVTYSAAANSKAAKESASLAWG